MTAQALVKWNHDVQAICGRFETRYEHHPALFIGDMQRVLLGTTAVAFIRSNAHSIAKPARVRGQATDPHCFLVLQQQGQMTIEAGEQVLDMREGDLALLDSATALRMTPRGLFSHVSIHLPRAALRHVGPSAYGKLMTTGLCGQLLSNLVRQVAGDQLRHWSCAADGQGLQNAVLALLEPVLNYPRAEQPGNLQRREIEALIQQKLSSTRLSPAHLADELGVSVRHLYRLFDAEGDSLCRYIHRQRLLKAATDLRDPACAHRSITDIGIAWGFADSAHFSKAFKKYAGHSPRDYRTLHRRQGQGGH